MPPIPADKLTPAQNKTVDEYKKARGGEPGGPWAVLTRSPELMSRTLMLSDSPAIVPALRPALDAGPTPISIVCRNGPEREKSGLRRHRR
jgi:hypothetical protein